MLERKITELRTPLSYLRFFGDKRKQSKEAIEFRNYWDSAWLWHRESIKPVLISWWRRVPMTDTDTRTLKRTRESVVCKIIKVILYLLFCKKLFLTRVLEFVRDKFSTWQCRSSSSRGTCVWHVFLWKRKSLTLAGRIYYDRRCAVGRWCMKSRASWKRLLQHLTVWRRPGWQTYSRQNGELGEVRSSWHEGDYLIVLAKMEIPIQEPNIAQMSLLLLILIHSYFSVTVKEKFCRSSFSQIAIVKWDLLRWSWTTRGGMLDW